MYISLDNHGKVRWRQNVSPLFQTDTASQKHESTLFILNCPSSKGNLAPNPKFERPNDKNTKSKNFLKSIKNWCLQLTWKLNEAISSKIWIESKQIKTNENQWRLWSFYILSLKQCYIKSNFSFISSFSVQTVDSKISNLSENRDFLSQLFGHFNMI